MFHAIPTNSFPGISDQSHGGFPEVILTKAASGASGGGGSGSEAGGSGMSPGE